MKLYKWYKLIRKHGWPKYLNEEGDYEVAIEDNELILVLEIMPFVPKLFVKVPSFWKYIKILHKGKIRYILFDLNSAEHINWWLIQ